MFRRCQHFRRPFSFPFSLLPLPFSLLFPVCLGLPFSTARSQQTSPRLKRTVTVAIDGFARTPGGAALSIEGISHGTGRQQRWWRLDHRIFSGAIIVDERNYPVPPEKDQQAEPRTQCVVALGLDTRAPEAVDVAYHVLNDKSGPVEKNVAVSLQSPSDVLQGQARHYTMVIRTLLPMSLHTGTLRVGIASAAWKDARQMPAPKSAPALNMADGALKVVVMQSSPTGIHIHLAGSAQDQDYRLVLVDKQGRSEPIPLSSENIGATISHRALWSAVKRVTLQKRPYEWIDFRDVPFELTP